MLDLVGNPEDQFSRVVAQITVYTCMDKTSDCSKKQIGYIVC